MRARTLTATLPLVLACGGGGPTDPKGLAPAAVRFDLVGPLTRVGTVGTLLGDVLTVTATQGLLPVAGRTVSFVVTEPGCGRPFAGSAVTDAQGRAVERWELGTRAGTCVMEVRAVDQTTGAPQVLGSFTATVQPGAADTAIIYPRLETGSREGVIVPLGDSVPLTALVGRAADRFGNVIAAPVAVASIAGSGVTVRGGYLVAGAIEASGTITVTVGAVTHTVPVHAVRDLRAGGWRANVVCRAPRGKLTGSFQPIDSARFDLVSDSVRYGGPGARSAAVFHMRGTLTHYTPAGTETHQLAAWPIPMRDQSPGALVFKPEIVSIGAVFTPTVQDASDPSRYVGGTWCPLDYAPHLSAPLVLTATP